MPAGHLDSKSSFDFIPRRGALDQGKGGVGGGFRDLAAGQLGGGLQLRQ
jgi:hypothetical protein